MSPLLNCPFCGGRAEIWKAQPGTTRKAWIACMTNRCAVLTREHLSDAEAVAAWNRRTPAGEGAARDEALEWLIRAIGCAGGTVNSSEYRENILNVWCDDRGPDRDDTFNLAHEKGYLQTGHDTSHDTSTTRLTDAGRAYFVSITPPEQSAAGHPVAVDGGKQAEVAKAAEPNTSNIKDQTHG